MQAVAISKGVSAAGGATDACRENLRAAWPLITEVGQTDHGLFLLSQAARSCSALQDPSDLTAWAQGPFFEMAEGNYPFPSTYITYSLLPGHPTALPAWPMRKACEKLNRDFGIKLAGSVREVNFTLKLGPIKLDVDWGNVTGNGANLTSAQIKESGVLELVSAVVDAAGVWHNLTKDLDCFDIAGDQNEESTSDINRYSADSEAVNEAIGTSNTVARQRKRHALQVKLIAEFNNRTQANASSGSATPLRCPSCPPCKDCPPCPVSYCDWEDTEPCEFCHQSLDKTFSWGGIFCNEAFSQIDIKGTVCVICLTPECGCSFQQLAFFDNSYSLWLWSFCTWPRFLIVLHICTIRVASPASGVGRDIFWPPEVENRGYSVESIVGPRTLSPFGCSAEYDSMGTSFLEVHENTHPQSDFGAIDLTASYQIAVVLFPFVHIPHTCVRACTDGHVPFSSSFHSLTVTYRAA